MTELSGTTPFLTHLGQLYDSFEITCSGTVAQNITPILHILRLTTLFLGLVCHSVPLNLLSLWQQRLFQKEAEIVKEWAEHYRTVKKRTARNETTKDKAGVLPPVVCEKAKSGTWIGVSFPDSRVQSLTTSVSHELVLRSTLPPPPPRLNLQIVLHFHA